MITNFIDAAAQSLCRGYDGVLGSFPSACLVSGGRPALVLTGAALIVVGGIGATVWKRFNR